MKPPAKEESKLNEKTDYLQDYDSFVEELKKFNQSFLKTIWSTITRSQLLSFEQFLMFIKRFRPLSEDVDNFVIAISTEEFGDSVLKTGLTKLTVKEENSTFTIVESLFENPISVGIEIKSWSTIKTSLKINGVRFNLFHKTFNGVVLICSSDLLNNEKIELVWFSNNPKEISARFNRGISSEMKVTNDTISNGLLNGVFEFHGLSSKLLEYWKNKGVSYSITTGRNSLFSNSMIFSKSLELKFEKAVYNVENVDPERIESIIYKLHPKHYFNGPFLVKKMEFSNISFYSSCILIDFFKNNGQYFQNYHNMVTSLHGKLEIDLGKQRSDWKETSKGKFFLNKAIHYKHDWKNESGKYQSYSAMPSSRYLPLKGFGFVTPYEKNEFIPHQSCQLTSLFETYQPCNEMTTEQLNSKYPNLHYIPTVSPLKTTGHFEGTILWLVDDKTKTYGSEFFIDTILGFLQIDLTCFGLGWCKLFQVSTRKILKIGPKCQSDISITCIS